MTVVTGVNSSDSSDSSATNLIFELNFFLLKIVTKLKKSNCDKNQKRKCEETQQTQIVTKLNNSNCDKTKKN